jgi:hypothetical protein
MSVRGVVKEISHNVKGTSRAGKEYTYTKFVYMTDTGEEKTKQLFKADVLNGIKAGDNVEIFFKKNDKGFFDLADVAKTGGAGVGQPETSVHSHVKCMSDKDVEIEVMNALNVASTMGVKTVDELVDTTKNILSAKRGLVEFAKEARTEKPAVAATAEAGDDPFEGVS